MTGESNKCCLCMSIRTGTMVLGWIGVIGSTMNFISTLPFTGMPRPHITRMCMEFQGSEVTDLKTCNDVVVGIMASTWMLGIITSILLLIGVEQIKPSLMLPYLIIKGIAISMASVLLFSVFLMLVCRGASMNAFTLAIISAVILSLAVYFFNVVRCCYKEVNRQSQIMESIDAQNIYHKI